MILSKAVALKIKFFAQQLFHIKINRDVGPRLPKNKRLFVK